jgi:hypothetical protein
MKKLYEMYFSSLLSPKLVHKECSDLMLDKNYQNKNEFFSIPYAIMLSWPFIIIGNLIHIITYYILHDRIEYIIKVISENQSEIVKVLLERMFMDMTFWGFISPSIYPTILVVSTIFFPVFAFIGIYIWKYFLRLGLNIGGVSHVEFRVDQILCVAASSYALLALPIGGEAIKSLLWVVFLFIGLVNNAKLSKFQAFTVLATPFLLVSIFSLVIVCSAMTIFLI